MVGFLQVLHRGVHGLFEYILFGPFGKSFSAFPYIETIIFHHVLNVHFVSLVTWIHIYFLEWKKDEQGSWKQAQTGEIVGNDGQRYYGESWRSREASSILTIKSSSSMDLALTFWIYKSIDVHLMPSPNKDPCNYQDAIWKAKLLHSPSPLLEKNPFLTPLHKRVKSKCMLRGDLHHLIPLSPQLHLSSLPKAPQFSAASNKECQDHITYQSGILEMSTFPNL